MKFTIIATIFAALATTGYSALLQMLPTPFLAVAAAVDETDAPQGIMNEGSENRRVLRTNEAAAAAANDEAPAMMEGTGNNTRALGTKNGAEDKKDYSGQSCHLCCEDDDYHC
jgi:hypothetical protein